MFKIAAKSWITLYFVFFFFIWGIFVPFWAVWLENKGMTPTQIGGLISLGLLLRFISNISLLPRLKTASSSLTLIRYLSLFILISFILLLFFHGWYVIAAFTLLLNFLMGPMVPLGDIVGARLVKQININYGQVRLWGSISFIVGSIFVGWTISEFGVNSILWLIIAALLMTYVLSFIKLTPTLEDQNQHSSTSNTNLISLFKQPNVIYFLLIMGAIQGSHGAYYAFSALYWDSVGISEFNIALLWGIGVFAEVILMRFNDKWFKCWSIKHMLSLALTAAILRWFALSQTTDFNLLIMVQTLHAFTFAVAHLAAIRFIAKQSEALMVGYQTLYSSVSLGLMMALFTYLSGWIYSAQQGTLFLWVAAALLPVFILLKRWKVE